MSTIPYPNKEIFNLTQPLVLLSAQKGPIIAFTVSVIIFMRFYRKKQGIKRTISFLMIVFIIVSPIAIGFANEIIQYTILRFREFGHRISVNEDRHVLLVYEAIYVWLSEIKNFFIGVGYKTKKENITPKIRYDILRTLT